MKEYAKDYEMLGIPAINTLETRRLDYIIQESLINSSLQNKEVEVTLISGQTVCGIVKDVTSIGLVIARNGDWEDRELIYEEDIENIDASEYPYYSFKHKRNLREQKKARFEFRFTKKELQDLIGKYVSINYDGKIIEGKVEAVSFNSELPSEILVCTPAQETKIIHDYRLRSLTVTGSNKQEHEGFNRLRDLEEELLITSEENYMCVCEDGCECPVGPKEINVEPELLLEKYFEAKMRILEGDTVYLTKFNYNWVQEVISRKHEYSNGGIDDEFYREIKKARDLNEYYNLRKSFIDLTFDKVRSINWTKYSKNQFEAEIEALEYIYESGVITN